MRYIKIIFVFLFISLLAACSNRDVTNTIEPGNQNYEISLTEVFDKEFVESVDQCSIPCWQGLVPGRTDFEQALIIIENNEKISLLKIYNNSSAISFKYSGMVSGTLYFIDNILFSISFDYDISIFEATKIFGDISEYICWLDNADYSIQNCMFLSDSSQVVYIIMKLKIQEMSISKNDKLLAFEFVCEEYFRNYYQIYETKDWNGYGALEFIER